MDMYDYIKLNSVPQPIRDLVLVKRGEVEDSTTKSGIIIPNVSRKLDNSGEVVALGDYARITKKGYRIPFEIEVGDYVYFEWQNATRKFKINDEFYLMLTEQEIILREARDG
jgi:co-chaperonin GroES (HSP10)